MTKKILFVSHDASHTGAPIVLLHLLNWIKINTNIDFEILLLGGGGLTNSFEKLSKTYSFVNKKIFSKNIIKRLFYRIYFKALNKIYNCNYYESKVLKKVSKNNYDLIYFNTVASNYIIPKLKTTHTKIVSHVHELSWTINALHPKGMSKNITSLVDLFIAPSIVTKENLSNYNIPNDRIKVFNEFISIQRTSVPLVKSSSIREELKFTDTEFIIGGSGFMHFRKGVDLFFQLSWLIQKKLPTADIKFLWVGNINSEILQWYFYETNIQHLKQNVFFSGIQDVPQNYFQIFDVFVLTSREDPFPLVCLEAACLGKPIICFDGAGGMTEFVDKGAGFKIPYHNIEEMSEKIIELYFNRDLVLQLGNISKNIVADYDVNIIAPNIYNEINILLDSVI